MRKIVVHRAGSYAELRLEERPDPNPGAGAILLDVHAAGVNYADCVVRMGLYESAKKYVGWPITPGFEVSGAVAALGEGVTDLTLGARLFGVTRFGGYASRVVLPRHQVFPLPERLTLEEAAGFPAVLKTAVVERLPGVRIPSPPLICVGSWVVGAVAGVARSGRRRTGLDAGSGKILASGRGGRIAGAATGEMQEPRSIRERSLRLERAP